MRTSDPGPVERRTIVAALVAPAAGLTAVGAAIVWWGRLPDPMALHWSLSGDPDGSMVRGAAVAMMVGIAVVFGLSSSALVLLGARGAGLLAGVGGMFSWVAWCTIVANAGAATWSAAPLPLAALLPGVFVGGAVAITAEHGVVGTPGTSSPAGAWVGRVGWSPVAPFGVAVLALLLLVFDAVSAAVIAVAAVAFAITLLSPVRVTADRRGLAIRYGWLPWPSTRIALSDIQSAGAIELRPDEWGGWGYPGRRRRAPGRAAVVLRRGPAIKLDLWDGSSFAVTVDGAFAAVEVLNDLLVMP